MKCPRLRAAILAAAVLAGLPGCDTKESGSPVEPVQPFFRIGLLDASAPVPFQHLTGEATIIAVSVFLDGSLIYSSRDRSPRPSERLPFAFYPSSFGSHTLRVAISDQTSSPNTYSLPDFHVILAAKVGSSTQAVATASLPMRTKNLATGESIEYKFSF